MIQNGLKPQPIDPRKYSYQRTFGSTAAVAMPEEFDFDAGLTMPDQNADGLPYGCTGYTTAEIAGDADNCIYDPRFVYDKTLEIEGIFSTDPEFERVGCTASDSFKAANIFGLKRAGETDQQATTHRKGASYDVLNSAGVAPFDAIKSAMWDNYQRFGCKESVSSGTPWLREWEGVSSNGIIPSVVIYDGVPTHYEWHNWKISGFKKIDGILYAKGKTWQGKNVGDGGWLYFPASVLNQVLKFKGSFAEILAPFTGDIQTVKVGIIITLISWIKREISLLTASNTTMPTIPPIAQPQPVEPQTEATTALLWDTPQNVRHAVRVMCDNAGLTFTHQYDSNVTDKNILCACVEQESGFNTKAVHQNLSDTKVVLSTDYGVCQINDFWHIGQGKDFPSVGYVLDNPEACISWMIQMFKDGKASQWSSFVSGAYKKWL